MNLYMKCTRNGNPSFSMHQGMTEAAVRILLADLGGTNIDVATAEEFAEANQL